MDNSLELKFRLMSKKTKYGKLHTFFELIKNNKDDSDKQKENLFEIYLTNIFRFNDGSCKKIKVREKCYLYKNEPHKILEKNHLKNHFSIKDILFENDAFLIEKFTVYENKNSYKYQISVLDKNNNKIFYLEQNGMFISF